MGTKNCNICGASYEAKRHNQKYCSKACLKKAIYKRLQDRVHNCLVPEHTKYCPGCGKEFLTRLPHKVSCTQACTHTYLKMRNNTLAYDVVACAKCGKTFRRPYGQESKTTCAKCSGAYYAQGPTAKCLMCKQEFVKHDGRGQRRYCSQECREKFNLLFAESKRSFMELLAKKVGE
jgi:hypothetical protein